MTKSKKITLIASLIFIVVGFIISILKNRFGLTLYIFNNTSSNIASILYLIGSIILTVFLIQITLYKRKTSDNKHLFNLILVGIIIVELILALYIWIFVIIHDNKYFTLVSEDSKHKIIVEEQSFLLAGYGNFYEKKHLFFVRKIGSYITDDGYRPFSDNRYSVEWLDDGAIIKYGFGSGGIEKEERLYYKK